MPTVIVSAKGWIVIPKEIRERHGLRKGDKVHVSDLGGHISIIPATKGDPIEHAYGMFKDGPSLTEGLLKDRREELERLRGLVLELPEQQHIRVESRQDRANAAGLGVLHAFMPVM